MGNTIVIKKRQKVNVFGSFWQGVRTNKIGYFPVIA